MKKNIVELKKIAIALIDKNSTIFEDVLIVNEITEKIISKLYRIPKRFRKVMELKLRNPEISTKKLAQILSMNYKTVDKRLNGARKMIYKLGIVDDLLAA